MRGPAGVRSATIVVGREVELDHLLRAVRGARAGQSSCTLVVGEGGVGKTRLLHEAITTARQLGMGVASGRAPLSTPAPFSVIAEALRSWLRAHAVSPMESPFDQGLRLVLPEWQAPAGEAADLDASQVRLLAQEGVVRVLRQIGAARGVLLVLDDLHAADPDSLDVVRYVSAAAIDGLVIIGALRPGEAPLADTLVASLRGSASASVVELDPLGPRAVGDLVASLLDAAPPAELIADVLARTDGVPLLIEEVVDAHVRAGSVQLDAGNARWRGGGSVVPLSVRGMVEARLEPLPAQMRDVVLASAVLARFEPSGLVALVAGCDDEAVGAAFARGVEAGLLATRGGTIAFRHDVIREAVLDIAIPSQVTAMHLRAAGDQTAGISDASRASHLAAAGCNDDAAELFANCAMRELRAHALLGAERLARQALDLGRSPSARVAAADALAAVLVAQGRWAEALAIDEATVARSGATVERLQRMASAALEAGYPDRAHALLRGVGHELPLTRVLAGRIALVTGDAAVALLEADAVLSEAADADTRLAALDIRARALDFAGERAAAEEAWAQQADLASAAGRTQAELRAVFQLGKQQFFDGRPPARLRQAVDLARSAGALIETAWAEETLAIALTLQGDPAAAIEVLDVAIPRARELKLDQLAYLLSARAGALSFTRESVDDLFAEVDALDPAPDVVMNNATIRGHIAMQRGLLDEAVIHYERGEALQSRMPGVAPMDAPCYLVWALAGLGRSDDAHAALQRAQTMPDLARFYVRPVIVDAGRALLAGDARGIDAAIASARGPMPFDVAIMRTVSAHVLGGDARVPWLREALDIYETAGATACRERIRSLLRVAGGPVPRRRRAPTTVPDELVRRGVTAREAEVLRLLGEGLSNADIAARLFLSVRTVETHVSSLLAKLQARSRGQLIAMSGTASEV